MSTQTSGAPYNPSRRLSPDQVRQTNFTRVPLGRRGVDEDEVQNFLGRLAEELSAREAEIAQLADENRRLKHAMREWHRQQVGYDSAELMARTQQEIEAQIAQAEQYSREREEEATRRYEEIVSEARRLAQEELSQRPAPPPAFVEPVEVSGQSTDGPEHRAVDPERLDQQRAYIQGLLQALDGLAAHVDATRRAFHHEVGNLDGWSGETPVEADDGAAPRPVGANWSPEPVDPTEPTNLSNGPSPEGPDDLPDGTGPEGTEIDGTS